MRCAIVLLTVCLVGVAPQAWAQTEPYNLTAPVRSLATIFTDLFGPRGLVVDSLATLPGEQPHSAHFNSDFQFNFTQFGTALVSQLVSVPLPSPAGGFTFQFDPSLGVFRRTTESFGPILADRADTIGARHFSLGFAYQRYAYDSVEGVDLGSIPAVFTHDNAALRGGREDVVVTKNAIGATVNQSTMFVTLGVTDSLDLSLAVPVVSTSLSVVSEATIHRLGTTNPLTHFFRQSDGEVGERRIFTATGSASGVGDLLIRVKSTIARRQSSAFAAWMQRAAANRRRDEPVGQRRDRTPAVRHLVGDVSANVAARQRQLQVERIERAGRQSGDRRGRTLPRPGELHSRN